MNKVILLGHVGADPQNIEFGQKNGVTKFPLATSQSYKTANGEKQQKTTWHQVSVFAPKLREVTNSWVKKGYACSLCCITSIVFGPFVSCSISSSIL